MPIANTRKLHLPEVALFDAPTTRATAVVLHASGLCTSRQELDRGQRVLTKRFSLRVLVGVAGEGRGGTVVTGKLRTSQSDRFSSERNSLTVPRRKQKPPSWSPVIAILIHLLGRFALHTRDLCLQCIPSQQPRSTTDFTPIKDAHDRTMLSTDSYSFPPAFAEDETWWEIELCCI
jgi:hypothetical protein